MPQKAKPVKPTRPVVGGEQPIQAKFWVLWEPPAKLLLVAFIGVLFAGAGFKALQMSNASPESRTAGQVVWQDAPDATVGTMVSPSAGYSTPLRNWRSSSSYIYGGASIKVADDATRSKAIEVYGTANNGTNDIHGLSQRAEQVADYGLRAGQTYWFGFDLKVVDAGQVASGRQSIWELLPPVENAPAKVWLSLNANRDGLSLETDNASLPVGPSDVGSWHRYAIGIRLSGDSDAWAEVWRDGQNVMQQQSLPGGAIAKGTSGALMAAGLYRSAAPWDVTLRMADFKIAGSRSAVQ